MEELDTISNRRRRWYDVGLGLLWPCVRWLAFIFFPIIFSFIAFLCYYAWRSAPYDLVKVGHPSRGMIVLSSDERALGSPFNREGHIVTFKQIPDDFINALLAREDEDFWEHQGIDINAVVRSFVRNLKDWSFTQGGSTLTMQLARNVFELRDKTLDRKFLEMAIARRIEARYTKEEILEAYANRVYFGAGAYGLADAAFTFFGKSLDQLSLSECATLAGIIRGPSIFNPFANLKAAESQRNETLDRMVAASYLSKEDADQVKQEPLVVSKNDIKEQVSFPLQWIRREYINDVKNQSHDGEEISDVGLKIISTFNYDLQRFVEESVYEYTDKLEKSKNWPLPKSADDPQKGLSIAVLAVHTKTGAIFAAVGGGNAMKNESFWVNSPRYLGNLFTPVVFAAASEASSFLVKDDVLQTGKHLDQKYLNDFVKRTKLDIAFPTGDDLATGEFQCTLAQYIPVLLAFKNAGYAPQLHSISLAITPNRTLVYQKMIPRVGDQEPLIPPDAAKAVFKLRPFIHDDRNIYTNVKVILPHGSGIFVGRIHSSFSVFVWMGQLTPTPEVFEDNKSFTKILSEGAMALSRDIFATQVKMPLIPQKEATVKTDKNKTEKKAIHSAPHKSSKHSKRSSKSAQRSSKK